MICFPNAKINIGLNVIRKKENGFHDIETVMIPVGLCDLLEIVENPAPSNEKCLFYSSGISIWKDREAQDNLCYKAYRLMDENYGFPPIKLHLHKIIPPGSGLGGGSSDAASAVKLINRIFKLNMSEGIMEQYVARLGSDCSFFIRNRPSLVYGAGELLEPVQLNLQPYFLVLVFPGIHISTQWAYNNVTPDSDSAGKLKHLIKLPVAEWRGRISNAFESTVIDNYPEIGRIKEKLYESGAVYASMSGSGSAVFGIFNEKQSVSSQFAGCFVWGSYIQKS